MTKPAAETLFDFFDETAATEATPVVPGPAVVPNPHMVGFLAGIISQVTLGKKPTEAQSLMFFDIARDALARARREVS